MGDSHTKSDILNDPEFIELVRQKNSISTTLTVIMLAVYFGFILLLAFGREILARPVGNATLGIPLGIGVIIAAWILTGVYVRWANARYDAMIAHFKARFNE